MKKAAPCPGPGRLSLFRRCRPPLPPKNQRKLKSKGDKVVHIDNMLVRLKGGRQQRRSPRYSSFTSQFSSSNADFTSHGLNSHLAKNPKVLSGPLDLVPPAPYAAQPSPLAYPCLFTARHQRGFRVRHFVCAVRHNHLLHRLDQQVEPSAIGGALASAFYHFAHCGIYLSDKYC